MFLRRPIRSCLAVIAVGALAACGTSAVAPGPQVAGHGQVSILPSTTPSQAYTMVARQIKACWFDPADPVLTHHVFRADAPAETGATTVIKIYGRTPEGRRGLKEYSIEFAPRRNGTAVTTANHKLPYALAQKLTSDVGYWIQGGANCSGPAPSGPPPRT
jgi:hypothetical protein